MSLRCCLAGVLLLALLACWWAPASSAGCKSCRERAMLCGRRCLLSACHRLGLQATLDELSHLSRYDGGGTSLLGLQNAARAKGLEAVGMKIGLQDLVSFNGVTVAHLWSNHFVLVEPGDADTVKVTDPPGEPIAVKRADFQKVYSGFALLIARDASAFPKPKDEGPDLRFDSYNWDFGAVDKGDIPTYSFKCRNAGSADLVISKVETSCEDCLGVGEWTRTIPPGGQGEVKVMVKTPTQQRGVAKEVYVTSNDPVSPIVHLQVTGYVRPAQVLFSPCTLNFGSPRRTESAAREVMVPVLEEDGFSVVNVSSDSPFVDAALSPSKIKDLPGYVITATLKPGAPIGDFKSKLTIESTHPKQPRAEVPVTATIRGNIDLDRDIFFLGIVKKGKEAVSSVAISTVARDPLSITKIDCPINCVSVVLRQAQDGQGYVLTATLKPDAPLGNIKGDVTIHTNDPDQPTLVIPVYAYVEQ